MAKPSKDQSASVKKWLMGMEVILRAEEDYRVTQANALIEADYQKFIPSRAQKIVRMIFSLIQPDDENFKIYKVKFEDVKRFLGYQDSVTWGRFRQDLRDIALSLYENKEILHIKEGKRELFAPWFASIEINEENDTLEFEISTKLKPYLLELKRNFTTYGLINIRNLRSSYSIRIYELLKQYAKIGYRQFSMEELRAKLGIPPEKYERYSQFKLRVIQKPQEDLREYTDIAFTFEELKTSRKVTAIYFRIYPNNPETYKPLQMDLFAEEEAINPDRKSVV